MEETDMDHYPTRFSPGTQLQSPSPCPAKALVSSQRQTLAMQALSGTPSITQLAQDYDVSRKFVYQQAATAQDALTKAFAVKEPPSDEVLFHLPVTKDWLEQLALSLVLICHSSYRGAMELLEAVFDYSISIGKVHDVVHAAVDQARRYNVQQDLAHVRIGAHDEIFQSGKPVLVGADVASTYCYLLSLEDHRDAETWGIRLLELCDRGFHPDSTIADAGAGLRAGQALAMPQTGCRGDVFHALQSLMPVVSYLDNRAYQAIASRSQLERKQAQSRWRRGCSDLKLAQKLRHAVPGEARAIALAEDVALLVQWLGQDILTVAGPSHAERSALYDFVVAELRTRVDLCPHRLKEICGLLENQRDDLLAFAAQLDHDLAGLAQEFHVGVDMVRDLLNVQAMEERDRRRWPKEAALRQHLRERFHPLSAAVQELAQHTVRASSVIENLNSRLRNYFFLRRHLGPDYLALLQFFLNHRRFLRSEHPERVGKSPAELLTGKSHPHWLEMLGYTRFSRN
jgi:hypothetical protein